jgi:hypothetical protein
MRSTGHSRWRGPAVMTAAGALAAAVVGPVYGWEAVIPIGVIAIVAAGYSYLMGGRDDDRGALARGRLDERQMLLRWQAWSFCAHVVFAASAVGALAAAVLRHPVWPFSVFLVFQAAAFYVGLAFYRSRDAGVLPEK